MGQQIVTSFLGGKVSERLRGRIDTSLYPIAMAEARNVTIALTGGASSRPGFLHRVSGGARLEPLILRRDLVFLMSIEDGWLRLYSVVGDTVTLVSSHVAPWGADAAWTLTYEQAGAVVIFADATFWPQILTVSDGGATFTFGDFAFEERVDGTVAEPMEKLVGTEVTLALSATSGTGITATASADAFVAGDVGRSIQVRDGVGEITGFTSATVVTIDLTTPAQEILDPDPFELRWDNNVDMWVTWPEHGLGVGDSVTFEGSGGVDAVIGEGNVNTTHSIVEVLNENVFRLSVISSSPTTAASVTTFGGSSVKATAAGPTRKWKVGVFGTAANPNPPQAVARHQQRLVFGGTPLLGDDRWFSRTGNIFNFDEGDGEDNHAVKAIGDTASLNIRHLVSGDSLEVFGDTNLIVMSSRDPITPRNKAATLIPTTAGCAYVRPQMHDGSRLYVDALGLHVRELMPEIEDARQFSSTPVTMAVPEVIVRPMHSARFEGSAADATPATILTNSDGTLAFFISQRSEKVAAWFTWDTDGTVISACGLGERLFLCVERDGATAIEEVDFSRTVRCDRAEKLTAGAATTAWTAPAFFFGRTVDLFQTDGTYLGPAEVDAAGAFETPLSLTDVWVGLPASWGIELLPVLAQYPEGLRHGKREKILRAIVHLADTVAIRVMGKRFLRPNYADLSQPPQLMNGAREQRPIGRRRGPRFDAGGSIADMANVLSVLLEVS